LQRVRRWKTFRTYVSSSRLGYFNAILSIYNFYPFRQRSLADKQAKLRKKKK